MCIRDSGVGTTIGAALGGAADSVASTGKGESTKAPEAPKPVETLSLIHIEMCIRDRKNR